MIYQDSVGYEAVRNNDIYICILFHWNDSQEQCPSGTILSPFLKEAADGRRTDAWLSWNIHFLMKDEVRNNGRDAIKVKGCAYAEAEYIRSGHSDRIPAHSRALQAQLYPVFVYRFWYKPLTACAVFQNEMQACWYWYSVFPSVQPV